MGDLDLDYVRMLWLLLEVCVVGNYLTLLLIGLSLIIISHCRVLGASCSRLPRPNTRLCIIHRGQIYMTTCIKSSWELKRRICKFWILFHVWNIYCKGKLRWAVKIIDAVLILTLLSEFSLPAKLACVQNKRKGNRSMFALPLPLSSSILSSIPSYRCSIHLQFYMKQISRE